MPSHSMKQCLSFDSEMGHYFWVIILWLIFSVPEMGHNYDTDSILGHFFRRQTGGTASLFSSGSNIFLWAGVIIFVEYKKRIIIMTHMIQMDYK